MSVFHSNALIGASGQGAGPGPGPTGYVIERSVRMNSSDSAYFNKTFGSAGNRKTWTWSGWVKRVGVSTYQRLFFGGNECSLRFENDNTLRFSNYTGTFTAFFKTTAFYRDFSAWYHIVLRLDTTQGTSSNRLRLYVNGEQVTDFSSTTYPSQNLDLEFNTASSHRIGSASASEYFSGYLADVHFIDGQSLAPTDFGEFDATTGVWNPIEYTGTFGTNGFHLDFEDNSTAAALGNDVSGNNNDWTVNNISVLGAAASPNWAADLTSSTGSFASGYPAANAFDGNTGTGAATSTGGGLSVNLTWTNTRFNSGNPTLRVYTYQNYKITVDGVTKNADGAGPASLAWVDCGTITGGFSTVIVYGYSGTSSGSYIAAIEVNGQILVGPTVAAGNDSLFDSPSNGTQTDTGAGGEVSGNYATLNPLANKGVNVTNGNLDLVRTSPTDSNTIIYSTIAVSSGKWYAEMTAGGDSIPGIALASAPQTTYSGGSAGSYGYYQSGLLFANGSTSSYGSSFTQSDVIGVALDLDAGTLVFYKNGVSQGTAVSSLSGTYVFTGRGSNNSTPETWNFGQRPFAYSAPSGYKALCTANLPTPTIEDSSTAMDIALYTGNGTSQTISGLNFSPDLVWIKMRSAVSISRVHALTDIVRGVGKTLQSNSTSAELSDPNALTAFNSDGFSLGSEDRVNENGATYVGWAWDGGSSTVSNTDGSITSSVRANASAGFSIVTWTNPATANQTIGHGLGVKPDMIIRKYRSNADGWPVYHTSIGQGNALFLNSTNAATADSNIWPNTINSTIFSTGNLGYFPSGWTSVAYCFAAVEGYSAFGSYTGNGSTDGPFVYTGMRPRFLLVKRTDAGTTGMWFLWDSERSSYNVVNKDLYPNDASAEVTSDRVDFCSNGFKIRSSGSGMNFSGNTYIYAAFAENPFRYSRAR